MNIRSASFIKGVVGTDDIFEDGKPQVVFIGRSNVGKSSVINSLANQKNLARTSSFPGRTQQINIFLINKAFYLVDLPGYGFTKKSKEVQHKLQKMINWYLFNSDYAFKKVILVIDAKIGPTEDDLEMFNALQAENKDIIIVANKIDKLKKSDYRKQLQKIRNTFDIHKVIPYSAVEKTGVGELIGELVN
jgi:GTP-binding protein